MAYSNGLPGQGPWTILAECRAPHHNSANAALGRVQRAKCVCPRALDLLELRKIKVKGVYVIRKNELRRAGTNCPKPEPVQIQIPDFSHGACTKPGGREAAQGGMNENMSHAGIQARADAKAQCEVACPERDMCRAYVLSQEKPAGSWGGVWGGLDPWNRKGQEVIVSEGRARLVPYTITR